MFGINCYVPILTWKPSLWWGLVELLTNRHNVSLEYEVITCLNTQLDFLLFHGQFQLNYYVLGES